MTEGEDFVTINKVDKERLVTIPGIKYSINHWCNDVLIFFMDGLVS